MEYYLNTNKTQKSDFSVKSTKMVKQKPSLSFFSVAISKCRQKIEKLNGSETVPDKIIDFFIPCTELKK